MSMRKFLVGGLVATSAMLALPSAQAVEVAASVGAANMYLWRGFDLGDGDAAVFGELRLKHESGLYAGVWGSSGDATNGNEYDLFAGWGGKAGPVDLDISLWTYIYPDQDIDAGDLVDIIASVGFGPVKATLYEAIEGDDANEYRYFTLGYTFDKFSVLYGQHNYEEGDDPGHIQFGYQYNDNLSFALSKFVVDKDNVDDDVQFLVSYSFPLAK